MPAQKIEVEAGAQRYMATVLHAIGRYAAVTHNGVQAVAMRRNGAWQEVYIHEVVARLAAADPK